VPRFQKRVAGGVAPQGQGVLHLSVQLPGVAGAEELELRVFLRRVTLRARGKFALVSARAVPDTQRLVGPRRRWRPAPCAASMPPASSQDLPLEVPVDGAPLLLHFVRKKALLRMELRVLGAAEAAEQARLAEEEASAEAGQAQAATVAAEPTALAPALAAAPVANGISGQRQGAKAAAGGVRAVGSSAASHGPSAGSKISSSHRPAASASASGTGMGAPLPPPAPAPAPASQRLYEQAGSEANRDAAHEAHRRGMAAAAAGSLADALRLVGKADSLWPGRFSADLAELRRRAAQGQQQQGQGQGQAGGPSGGGEERAAHEERFRQQHGQNFWKGQQGQQGQQEGGESEPAGAGAAAGSSGGGSGGDAIWPLAIAVAVTSWLGARLPMLRRWGSWPLAVITTALVAALTACFLATHSLELLGTNVPILNRLVWLVYGLPLTWLAKRLGSQGRWGWAVQATKVGAGAAAPAQHLRTQHLRRATATAARRSCQTIG
jgi:hypothetical protein